MIRLPISGAVDEDRQEDNDSLRENDGDLGDLEQVTENKEVGRDHQDRHMAILETVGNCYKNQDLTKDRQDRQLSALRENETKMVDGDLQQIGFEAESATPISQGSVSSNVCPRCGQQGWHGPTAWVCNSCGIDWPLSGLPDQSLLFEPDDQCPQCGALAMSAGKRMECTACRLEWR